MRHTSEQAEAYLWQVQTTELITFLVAPPTYFLCWIVILFVLLLWALQIVRPRKRDASSIIITGSSFFGRWLLTETFISARDYFSSRQLASACAVPQPKFHYRQICDESWTYTSRSQDWRLVRRCTDVCSYRGRLPSSGCQSLAFELLSLSASFAQGAKLFFLLLYGSLKSTFLRFALNFNESLKVFEIHFKLHSQWWIGVSILSQQILFI